ncbi:hypothetical protein ABEU20_003191 [Rhodococcus sp. PAM 2766]|uniref:Secreted protein n=1 Tax=Rhodococcus parequi TaxID=3137122 RepID=A0ABW9FGA2_9NOCA
MNLRARNLLGRSAIGIAAIAATGIAAPALAGATPVVKAPVVDATVAGNTISVAVQNTNTDSTVTCGAVVVVATKISELEADPAKLFQPGFAAYRTPTAERVAASNTKTFTTADLTNGAYAAFGECASSADPSQPKVSKAPIVSVPDNAMFGSLQNGAFQDILDFVTTGAFDSLIDAISAGSSQPVQ